MSLRGRRFIWASETDDKRRFSTSTVKWLTGSDTLVGRAAHAPFPTTFRPTHKLVLMTNEIPSASADDMAFWRRVHLVDFRLTFVEGEPARENERRMDKGILDKLKAEASGIPGVARSRLASNGNSAAWIRRQRCSRPWPHSAPWMTSRGVAGRVHGQGAGRDDGNKCTLQGHAGQVVRALVPCELGQQGSVNEGLYYENGPPIRARA
jgi:hypothetical protein